MFTQPQPNKQENGGLEKNRVKKYFLKICYCNDFYLKFNIQKYI